MFTGNPWAENPCWFDHFTPTEEQQMKIDELYKDFLVESADICKLDTTEWEEDDYDSFQEIIGH